MKGLFVACIADFFVLKYILRKNRGDGKYYEDY